MCFSFVYYDYIRKMNLKIKLKFKCPKVKNLVKLEIYVFIKKKVISFGFYQKYQDNSRFGNKLNLL